MFQVKGFHHASLLVENTGQSLAFYRDTLGMQVDDTRPDLGYPGAWLKLGDVQVHLLELPNPDPLEGRPDHGGRDRHLAFHINDLNLLVEKLSKENIPFTTSHSGRKALFCRDPDQNALEFIEN